MTVLPRRADVLVAALRGVFSAKTWPRYSVLRLDDGHHAIVEVHDGDTFRLVLVSDPEAGIGQWPSLRLAGADAWELKEVGGVAARDFTATMLHAAETIEVELGGWSFGRRVARVFVDGRDLAPLLIDAGHAVKWPK